MCLHQTLCATTDLLMHTIFHIRDHNVRILKLGQHMEHGEKCTCRYVAHKSEDALHELYLSLQY